MPHRRSVIEHGFVTTGQKALPHSARDVVASAWQGADRFLPVNPKGAPFEAARDRYFGEQQRRRQSRPKPAASIFLELRKLIRRSGHGPRSSWVIRYRPGLGSPAFSGVPAAIVTADGLGSVNALPRLAYRARDASGLSTQPRSRPGRKRVAERHAWPIQGCPHAAHGEMAASRWRRP